MYVYIRVDHGIFFLSFLSFCSTRDIMFDWIEKGDYQNFIMISKESKN